ncbi:MAG: carboxypeptidase-like regulatory domain-containing protein [Bacteroidetes bacterium]|nr:carboxypeptidase-like regulatory domain-containing protein [Bacteroidota bacterium]
MKTKTIIVAIAMIALVNVDVIAADKSPKTSGPSTQSSISGVVIDKDSNEKLAGVTIQLASTDQKIYSNSKGEFNLDGIEPGTYKVKINCISYKDKEVTVKITKSETEKLKILLNPITP